MSHPVLTRTFTASGAIGGRRIVKFSADNVVTLSAAATDFQIGVSSRHGCAQCGTSATEHDDVCVPSRRIRVYRLAHIEISIRAPSPCVNATMASATRTSHVGRFQHAIRSGGPVRACSDSEGELRVYTGRGLAFQPASMPGCEPVRSRADSASHQRVQVRAGGRENTRGKTAQ